MAEKVSGGGAPDASDLFARLLAAATSARRAEQEYRDRLAARDELIRQAVDAGYPIDRIAHAALVTNKRVLQVLGRRD